MKRWLGWIVVEWSVILGGLLLALIHPWLAPLAILLVGRGQTALLVLGHEALHHSVEGQSLRGNQLANLFCFWPCGVDLYAFRAFHLAHHATLGTLHDPEVIERARWPEQWAELTPQKKRRLLLGDLLGNGIPEALSVTLKIKGIYKWPRVVFTLIALGLLLTLEPWLLVLWLWSLFTVSWACARARMWKEHWDLGPGETHEYQASWWQRLYMPHYIWKHRAHHKSGNWSRAAWDL